MDCGKYCRSQVAVWLSELLRNHPNKVTWLLENGEVVKDSMGFCTIVFTSGEKRLVLRHQSGASWDVFDLDLDGTASRPGADGSAKAAEQAQAWISGIPLHQPIQVTSWIETLYSEPDFPIPVVRIRYGDDGHWFQPNSKYRQSTERSELAHGPLPTPCGVLCLTHVRWLHGGHRVKRVAQTR